MEVMEQFPLLLDSVTTATAFGWGFTVFTLSDTTLFASAIPTIVSSDLVLLSRPLLRLLWASATATASAASAASTTTQKTVETSTAVCTVSTAYLDCACSWKLLE